MASTQISLEHTGRFNRLILDYINGDEKLNNYYSLPHTIESYKKQIENRRQFPIDRELLVKVLKKQYASIGKAKGAVLKNIDLLLHENTFTVTTGHQLNIFTGPLFFLYKILHTISLTEELKKAYADQNFVPVYWMNAEDHDLEEIGNFNLFGKKYNWETKQTGATGRMNPSSLSPICDKLDEVFDGDEKTGHLISIFRKAYSEFGDLASATRYFVNELFEKYGLVIIDGDDTELKRSFSTFIKEDLLENRPYELVKAASLELKKASYHVQVNPREINSFYLIDGIRNRIVKTDKGFHVLRTDVRFTEKEILEEIESHPERFSPNVVLRPLFQEFVLPNLTYVGGAGELSYWLQYQNCFNELNVSFPLLGLRNHFLLTEKGIDKRMDDLKLMPEDLFHSIDELINGHILEVEETDFDFSKEMEFLSKLYSELKNKAADSDASLVNSLEAEEKKQQKTIEQWGSRFSRGLKKKNEVSINRIRKIHSKLFPAGYLQERHDNLMEFYSKSGDDLIETIYNSIQPFDTRFQALRLNE